MKTVTALHLLRHLGPRWVAFRAWYAWQRRTGLLTRRSEPADWSEIAAPAENPALRTLFAERPPVGAGGLAEADEILAGRFRLFSWRMVEAGFPPRWHRNQLTGEEISVAAHWSALGDFAPDDIKGVWELSRFPWAFPLARAYARTGEERYAEGFWRLFESWCGHARPNCGPNWMCGQEATFRLMAATFARVVCAGVPATTPARVEQFRRFAHATGRRIAANLAYALSQSNNHGVSECVGLITAAALLPEAPDAAEWRRAGMRALERQLAALVYADGGFAQHSANYHRVLLHDLIWCEALLRGLGEERPAWLAAAGRRATQFLGALVDAGTGRVPLYGANDGANVLPLADGDFADFRPTLQAAAMMFEGRRRLAAGSWDELGAWMAGAERSASGGEEPGRPPAEERVHQAESGCLIWRRGGVRLFLRCPKRFRHRPSQADLLHVDLAWRGQAIAIDAGTFSYHAPGKFSGALKEAAVHNTVTFDDLEPMAQAGRFLYLPWPRGDARWTDAGNAFTATHDGWAWHGLAHRRTVRSLAEDQFEVEDEVGSSRRCRARVQWLLADWPHRLEEARQRVVLDTPAGAFAVSWEAADARATVVRGDEGTARGWWSPHYAEAVPALSLVIEFSFSGAARCVTRFGPAD